MSDVAHVPPATASQHGRAIRTAILQESSGSTTAADLVFAIDKVLASVFAEGFAAGRVHAQDTHYAAEHFAEDRKKQSQA